MVMDGPVSPVFLAICHLGEGGEPCSETSTSSAIKDASISGLVVLEEVSAEVTRISYRIVGLAPGKHGFHIHESADFSRGCASAGPHYNPYGKRHGGPCSTERHVGDLGNVVADERGVAFGVIHDTQVKLRGPHSVLGRSCVVHSDEDDLGCGGHELSSTTGNAGARIACGEIVLLGHSKL